MSEELLEYKCPNCGGKVEFDSHSQNMKCPYCDSEFDVESLAAMDESLGDAKPDDMQWNTDSSDQWSDEDADGMRTYLCDSCGGEIVCDANTAASACPFCGSPVVMAGNVAGTLRPDLVIPFKIDKKAAKEALKRHTTGKKLLPKIFCDENHLEEIQGIYVPFWLFDADADVQLRFRGTKNRIWSDRNYNYTETQYYSVQRGGSLSFSGVPVDSSEKMPDDLMESIEPYNLSDAVDFQTAYLSGYLAEKYGSTADDCVPRANKRLRQTAQAVADRYGIPVVVDERFIEQDFGIYEGVDRAHPGFLAGKRKFCFRHPGGESMMQLAQRVYNGLDDIRKNYTGKNVLVVCHGGVCRMIRTYFEDMENETFSTYSPDNASLTEYEI